MGLFGPCGCCGGGCCQDGDIFCDDFDVEFPGLDAGVTKWDVLAGVVDVIGNGPHGAFYDLLPGRGYYLDLSGSLAVSLDATIRTKDAIVAPAGNYRLSLRVAGNQRADVADVEVLVEFGSVSEVITVANWLQGFTLYQYDLTGPLNDKIVITQLPGPVGRPAAYGNLLDCVRVTAL